MESPVAVKIKESLPEKKEKKKLSCGTLLGGFLVGLLILLLLAAAGIAAAVAATGLVDVPVLSSLFKPPAVTEDFSYTTASEKQLESKLLAIEEGEGKINVTLTDDEVNTLVSSLLLSPDVPVKELLVKFTPGVIKIKGTLSQNDAPFYLEIVLEKRADFFELEIQRSRLGALPIPGSLIRWAAGNFLLGADIQPAGEAPADAIPADGVSIRDGSIIITGLDLSGLGGPQE